MDANSFGITDLHRRLGELYVKDNPQHEKLFVLENEYTSLFEDLHTLTKTDAIKLLVIKNKQKYQPVKKRKLKPSDKFYQMYSLKKDKPIDTYIENLIEDELKGLNNKEKNFLLLPVEEIIRPKMIGEGIIHLKNDANEVKYRFLGELLSTHYENIQDRKNIRPKTKVKELATKDKTV